MAGSESTGGFTSGELKAASWWVRYGEELRRFGFGVLVLAIVAMWGYAAWSLLDAFAISYPRESRINKQIAQNQEQLSALELHQPKRLVTDEVLVFETTDRRLDLSAEVRNPNADWWADVQYHFTASGEQTPLQSSFILPGATQVLSELGYRQKNAGGKDGVLVLDRILWHRVDPGVVGASYAAYAAPRMQLSFDKITYDTNILLGTKRVGQTSFTLINNSSYGFWSVELFVRLYRGGSVSAVNKIRVEQIQPGEQRPLKLIWLDNPPGVTKTEIIPIVNVLDPHAFLPTEYFTK